MTKKYYGKTTSTSYPIVMKVSAFHRMIDGLAAALFLFVEILAIKEGQWTTILLFLMILLFGIYKTIHDCTLKVVISKDHTITKEAFLQKAVTIQAEEIKDLIVREEYTVDMFYLYSDSRCLLKINSTWENTERFIQWCKKNKIGKDSF